MTLGELLKSKRKEQNLTIAELSKKTGLSLVSINHFETGKTKPSLTSLNKLANGLGCDFEELYKLI